MTRQLPSPFESDPRPVVAVFRSPVFNASETFVSAQAAGLVRYQPLVVGLYDRGNVPPALAGRVMLPANARDRLTLKLGDWRSLGERVRRIGPALVHAHFGPDGVLALPLAKRLGVPMVTSLRGYDVTRSRAGMAASGRLSLMRYAFGQRALARQCDLFLAVSDALRERAVAAGFPADRTVTLYNGVDLARFPASVGDDERTILHVGRLVEKKGTALLLAAFAEVRKAFPAASLVIIGDGPGRGPLERQAVRLGLGDSVRFLGAQPPTAVGEWMRRAAILAAPSLAARNGDAEGLPNVVVEAAASGLAIVASRHSGIPEAVIDGSNGFLVAEGEAEPLARRLEELLAAPDLRRRMGAAGRALAEERFDVARQIEALERHYDSLVAAGAAQRTAIRTIETR
jgi:colanic acid/amylovoran biosynthesis glycosyltransferase